MATKMIVPTLGESISEAVLVDWSINEGDSVRRGDEIVELETGKANLALECPANGVLLSILVHTGETVTPGQVLALIGRPGEDAPAAVQPAASDLAWEQPGDPAPALGQVQPLDGVPVQEHGERISPAARRMARELGIDLSNVTASRPGLRITSEDVQRYVRANGSQASVPDELPFRRIELSRIQKAVAERMVESALHIPQFSVSMEVEASSLLRVKQELSSRGIQASVTALLVHLTARALVRHPLLNARYDGDSVLAYETVNMAVAAATRAGLLAPVLHAVEKLSLPDIARQLADLLPAARENKLSLDQVSKATFTLSNLGMYGVQQFVPLISPPQSAILGVGAARLTSLPIPTGGVRTAWLMTLTVSADHRVLDGEAAALFLTSLREEIERADIIL